MGRLGLSLVEILDLCDVAGDGTLVERARLLCGRVRPDLDAAALAAMPIGQRDAWLLELREQTLGPRAVATVACPVCGRRVTVDVDVEQLRFAAAGGAAVPAVPFEQVIDGFRVMMKVPTVADLDAAERATSIEAARAALIAACIVQVNGPGGPMASSALSEGLLARISEVLIERDPQVEVLLDLSCAWCAERFEAEFDIARFFWAELSALSAQLIDDVHVLAKAYGWDETQILALPPRRRRRYVELVRAESAES